MAEFIKSTSNTSPFSVRELLDLKDDSPNGAGVLSDPEEQDEQHEEKLELGEVESEMEGDVNYEKDSSRFSRDYLM
jgi:hypothetical protein